MEEWLLQMADWHAMEVLFVLAVVLILIDYFFATDVPAHFGYFCFAAAMFLVASFKPFPLRDCLIIAVVIWISLAVLHQTWFRHYLENAPGTAGYESDDS